mgnify:CR=1 FL=1
MILSNIQKSDFFRWILLGSFGLWYVVEIDYLGEGMKSIFACFVSAFIGVSALAAVQSIQVETMEKDECAFTEFDAFVLAINAGLREQGSRDVLTYGCEVLKEAEFGSGLIAIHRPGLVQLTFHMRDEDQLCSRQETHYRRLTDLMPMGLDRGRSEEVKVVQALTELGFSFGYDRERGICPGCGDYYYRYRTSILMCRP